MVSDRGVTRLQKIADIFLQGFIKNVPGIVAANSVFPVVDPNTINALPMELDIAKKSWDNLPLPQFLQKPFPGKNGDIVICDPFIGVTADHGKIFDIVLFL